MASRQTLGKLFIPFLISGMLATGCIDALLLKYQDMQCVANCDNPDPREHVGFEQPVWQTLQMFAGEMLCFIPIIYYRAIRGYRDQPPIRPTEARPGAEVLDDKFTQKEMKGWAPWLFWIPAACDLTGTTLLNVGLLYTPVSIFQMTRGALVLWVGLFSVIFLRRHLWLYQWLALVTVMVGVSLVGLFGSLAEASPGIARPLARVVVGEAPQEPTKVFIGILFIFFSQIFTAAQFVIEEKIVKVYDIDPLLAVGYQGIFGFSTILLAFPVLNMYKSYSTFFDIAAGWNQLIHNETMLYTSIGVAISIGLFSAFGLQVTRHVNAAARSTAGTCRTIGIWAVSLFLGWEHLLWPWTPLQLLGFAILVYGTFVFNDLTEPPPFLKPTSHNVLDRDDERRPLLAESAPDESASAPANRRAGGRRSSSQA